MKAKIQWPWSHHRLEKLRRELLNLIESQLNAAGIKTQRRRPGLRMKIAGRDMRVWLTYYYDQHWWRLTCGYGSDQPGWEYQIQRFAELTMCREEIVGTTGFHLAQLLRSPETYRWPLFTEGQWRESYPSYSWSVAGWESIQIALEARKALIKREAP